MCIIYKESIYLKQSKIQTMRKISLKEHQKIMLDILTVFADFCDRHNLLYFLDAGTLLGAIRHKGFIPWDNDADVCMPRPDFNRFIELMERSNYKLSDNLVLEKPEQSIHTFYKIVDLNTRLVEYPDGSYPFESHVYIDVFIKDGLPSNLEKAKRICKKSERLSLWHWFYKRTIFKWEKGHNPFKKLVGRAVDAFVCNKNRAYFKQKSFIEKISKKYPYKKSEYVTTLGNGEFYRRCKRSNFDSYVLMDFENKKFKVPAGYDDWLIVLYGNNYLTPPPKEKQQIHNIIVEVNN